ncbi:hypothetical protein L7F22_066404 [Adiantum nelumboides]|nr:hypothetical protein [Adiantum nelumboides]
MQAALLAELRELERELLQRFDSAFTPTTPSALKSFNTTKLAIATCISASQAKIVALLESVNEYLGVEPPDLDAGTSTSSTHTGNPNVLRKRVHFATTYGLFQDWTKDLESRVNSKLDQIFVRNTELQVQNEMLQWSLKPLEELEFLERQVLAQEDITINGVLMDEEDLNLVRQELVEGMQDVWKR